MSKVVGVQVAGLADDLMEVYTGLGNGTVDIKEATAKANVAGKVIGIMKVVLVASVLMGREPHISVLTQMMTPKRLKAAAK